MTQHFSEDQIRELAPLGVYRSHQYASWQVEVVDPPPGSTRLTDNYLSPSQLSERVLHCETCGGTARIENGWRGWRATDGDRERPCPKCKPFRALLLKLAGERVES